MAKLNIKIIMIICNLLVHQLYTLTGFIAILHILYMTLFAYCTLEKHYHHACYKLD